MSEDLGQVHWICWFSFKKTFICAFSRGISLFCQNVPQHQKYWEPLVWMVWFWYGLHYHFYSSSTSIFILWVCLVPVLTGRSYRHCAARMIVCVALITSRRDAEALLSSLQLVKDYRACPPPKHTHTQTQCAHWHLTHTHFTLCLRMQLAEWSLYYLACARELRTER